MNAEKVHRVLVYLLASLGDTCVALPAFHLVRSRFPNARITLLTSFPIGTKTVVVNSLLDGTGLVDDYLNYPAGLRRLGPILEIRKQIASNQYDLLVYMQVPKGGFLTSLRDSLFFWSCGITRQIGIPFRRSDREYHLIEGSSRYTSETVRMLGCLQELGRPDLCDDRWWDLRLSSEERHTARQLLIRPDGQDLGLKPFLVVSVGTKWAFNDWTEPNWLELIRVLNLRHQDFGLVLLGGPDDRDRSARMQNLWHGLTLNLCGQASPRVSAAIMERASLFIGHDSGPMHLAATVGTPCVAVFSARNAPGVWFPRGDKHQVFYNKTECFGCGLNDCLVEKKRCILAIQPNDVAAAVSSIVKGLSTVNS